MMRKVMLALAAVGMVALIAACASAPAPAAAGPAPSGLPDWFLDPPQADDAIYGVGSAQMSRQDAAIRMARSRAREDIAFQMNAQIQAAIVDYFQEAGVDDNVQTVNFVETISRQVTETTLQNLRNEATEIGPDGTVYALVSAPLNTFREQAAQAFQRNEDAAFAEFKADQALQMLDSQMQNNPSSAGTQN